MEVIVENIDAPGNQEGPFDLRMAKFLKDLLILR